MVASGARIAEASDGAARKRAEARRAAAEATRERIRLERDYARAIHARLERTERELSGILGDHVTDFRRFTASSLLDSVDRAMRENRARLEVLSRGQLPTAARLGLDQVDQPLTAAGLRVTLGAQVDARLVSAAFENGVVLLSPPMQQFQARAAMLARQVATGGETQAQALQKLGDAIAGQGFQDYAFRAERILRTELSRTLSEATYQRMVTQAERFPFVRKCWRATRDSRTRETHTEAGTRYGVGSGIPIADRFEVGEVRLRFPVDPDAEPSGAEAARETIMCRCNLFVDFDLAAFRAFTQGQAAAATRAVVPAPAPRPKPKPRPRPLATGDIIEAVTRDNAVAVMRGLEEAFAAAAGTYEQAARQAMRSAFGAPSAEKVAHQLAAISAQRALDAARVARDTYQAQLRERLLAAAAPRVAVPAVKATMIPQLGATILKPNRAQVAVARARFEEAAQFVGRLTTRRELWRAFATQGREVRLQYAVRAHAHPGIGAMTISPLHDTGVYVHELGHLVEWADPAILRATTQFLERRTRGNTLTPLSKFGSGFGPDEVTLPDEFLVPYMGKQYLVNGRRTATEILSMGLERLWRNPAELAQADPEFFSFLLDLLGPVE